MALLKALVIGMGVLIVLAMGMLAYGLISKTGDTPNTAPTASSVGAFGDLVIPDAERCRIEDAATEGNRLIVTLGGAAGCRKILVVDMSTGAIAGSVRLAP